MRTPSDDNANAAELESLSLDSSTTPRHGARRTLLDCGADVVSPVNRELIEVRRVNAYDPTVDNPATRGGRSISILGDDGVRYYLAHFDTIVETCGCASSPATADS
jgi:hypothetical protein